MCAEKCFGKNFILLFSGKTCVKQTCSAKLVITIFYFRSNASHKGQVSRPTIQVLFVFIRTAVLKAIMTQFPRAFTKSLQKSEQNLDARNTDM